MCRRDTAARRELPRNPDTDGHFEAAWPPVYPSCCRLLATMSLELSGLPITRPRSCTSRRVACDTPATHAIENVREGAARTTYLVTPAGNSAGCLGPVDYRCAARRVHTIRRSQRNRRDHRCRAGHKLYARRVRRWRRRRGLDRQPRQACARSRRHDSARLRCAVANGFDSRGCLRVGGERRWPRWLGTKRSLEHVWV